MKPVPEWRRVLLRAWSVRINIALALFSAGGSAISLVNADPSHPYLVPAIAFAFTAIGNIGAIFARVTRQKKLQAEATN
jgi:hypothetical protein